MELLIAFLGIATIAALGPLAARFGCDSRDAYRFREYELGVKEPIAESGAHPRAQNA